MSGIHRLTQKARNNSSGKYTTHIHFDAYIVGSDQTWRPKYVPNIYNYYLNFIPSGNKVKRISFGLLLQFQIQILRMITVSNLEVQYGKRVLFKDIKYHNVQNGEGKM